mmetsp:Transcript_17817/g.31759  ORF Transcript_17817/g.31759 Transcript_17817/m.31759 type:complete len:398 (-) Transcript_17817:157-1350(-)
MSLYAMPIVMANLGAEMIYILEQRLKAQQIPEEKGNKVLQDVVLNMFKQQFYNEAFKPQEVYNIASVRQVFDKLAHSSIMRLSTSSMDKLYDLMLMGLKYQLVCCRSPDDILKITLLHLNSVKDIVKDSNLKEQVESIIQKSNALYSTFDEHSWLQLRATLARFLKDKRVKVSLFLQEGIQASDGKMLLPIPLPQNPNDPQPGTVKVYDSSGAVASKKNVRLGSIEVDTSDFHCHPHPLGANLYDKSRTPFVPPKRRDSAKSSVAAAQGPEMINSPKPRGKLQPPEPKTMGTAESLLAAGLSSAGKEELNVLAQLIAPSQPDSDNFKLNLFPDNEEDAPTTIDVSPGFDPKVNTVNFGSSTGGRQGLDQMISNLDIDGETGTAGQDEDLLDLMDRAG